MGRLGQRQGLWLLSILFLLAAPLEAYAQAAPPGMQVFLQLEGSVPDWVEFRITVSRLEVGGLDPQTGKRFLVAAPGEPRSTSIPREASGSPRMVALGTVRAGSIDRVHLSLGSASLVLRPPADGSPKVIPISVQDNALKLKPMSLIALKQDEVLSVVAKVRIGKDAVLTNTGLVAMSPTYTATLFVPGVESFLNGGEQLIAGPPAIFETINVRAKRAKAINGTTGDVRNLVVDERTGAQLSFTGLRDRNETAWRARHGAMIPSLVAKLGLLDDSDTVAVDVWVDVPGPLTFMPSGESFPDRDAAHAEFIAQRSAAAQPYMETTAKALEDAGATIESIEFTPPVLHVRATRAVWETVGARLSGIVEIRERLTDVTTHIGTNAAADMVQGPLHLGHLLGVSQLARIALVEPNPCVRTSHQAFIGITWDEPLATCTSDNLSLHATSVAGALGARVPEGTDNRRPPPGLTGLFQGHMFLVDSCNVSEELLKRTPHLVNLSCHSGTEANPGDGNSTALDYAVFTHRIFVANGAGNVPTGTNYDTAETACWAYNSLCVGGYNWGSANGVGNFGDDIPAGRYVNHATAREKPDLAAPYSNWLPETGGDTMYDQQGGTSFSTPLVVGMAGLLIGHDKLLFNDDIGTGNPTLMRALLMASASHGMPNAPPVPLFSDSIDDKTGAGGPRGDRALKILDQDRMFTRLVSLADDFDGSHYLRDFISFNADPGDKVRVVMTYDQCIVKLSSVEDKLQADLDLIVLAAGGARMNNSMVDNTEIVEFTAPTRTSVNVKVKWQHWTACSDGSQKTHLAIAWDVLAPYEQ